MRFRRYCVPFIMLLVILISGCTTTGDQQTTEPMIETEAALEPTSTSEMTVVSESPTAAPTTPSPPSEPAPSVIPSEPAPTLSPGSALDIASIFMIDRQKGWAIGGTDRGRDRILYTQDGARTFRDVTPPIGPAPTAGIDRWAVGTFLSENIARVVYFPAILEPTPPGGAEVVIWRTQDAGATWQQSAVLSTSTLGTQDYPPRLFFLDADQGWFMARNGGAGMHRYPVSLYRTVDGGASWETLIDAIGGSELQSCRKTDWAFGDARNGLATIDNCPVDGPAIEQTTDGGKTWERIILPPPLEDPDTVSSAYCETRTPQYIGPGIVVMSASCTAYSDPMVQRELLYRSGDNGQTWDAWDFPGGELLFLDELHGFALSREIYWTADGGVTWEVQKVVNWDGQFSFVDPDFGWAVARAEEELALVSSDDRGQTWQIIEAVVLP